MQGATTGLVYVSHTYRLQQRIRLARASCSEYLGLLGIVPADDRRADRFKEAHARWRVRASFYEPSPEVLAYFKRRSILKSTEATEPERTSAAPKPVDETTAPAVGTGPARPDSAVSGEVQEQISGEEAA